MMKFLFVFVIYWFVLDFIFSLVNNKNKDNDDGKK